VGLLDRLTRKTDRTAGWVRDPALRLTLDLARGTLCGVALGEPVERLASLGPTGRNAEKDGDLQYQALGLIVGVSEEAIDSFIVYWRDYLGQGFEPYAGTVLSAGQVVLLGPRTTEAELVAVFGRPYFRDQDEDETLLFYEIQDRWGRLTERQVELDEKGALRSIIFSAEPMLADERQRKAFGVDEPWPPR
jgi:hypothetical protein